MAVALRHRKRGMAEDLHYDALVDAGSDQIGCHAVPQVMRSVAGRQARGTEHVLERFVHAALTDRGGWSEAALRSFADRLADLVGKYQVMIHPGRFVLAPLECL